MRKGNYVLAALCIAASVLIIAISSTYPTAKAYGTGVPGPGLWPMAISIVLLICSVLLIYRTKKMPAGEDQPIDMFSQGPKRAYAAMAILIVYVLVLEPLGFLISTTILETIFIKWFSKKSFVVSLLIAAVATGVVFAVFQYVLNVPVGSFGLLQV